MRLTLLTLTVLLCAVGPCLSARILAVLPFPGKSHFIFHWSIFRALAGRGHQVVEYSPFPPSTPIANHTHVPLHSRLEQFISEMSFDVFMELAAHVTSRTGFISLHEKTFSVCEDTFRDPNIQKLLNSNEHFDLVFIESTFGQESLLVFGHKFNAPVIALHTTSLEARMKMDAGDSLSLAYNPDYMSIVATDCMSLAERMESSVMAAVRLLYYYLYQLPEHDKLLREHFSESAPPIRDMVRDISVVFTNSHPAIEYIQPYTPNLIPLAGINVSPDRIPIPQDLQKFMDEGTDGVIYFSLGSVVPMHTLPKQTLQVFINVFKTLKQKVLWKINNETLPGLSKNVKLSKWFPQPGVLAHPNCVLFVTHGGLFSQYEALHAGVPTVGIPFFADQPFNIRFSEHRGFGVKLDFESLSEQTLTAALHAVLKNSSYRENAQRLSRIFRDRPVSPADSVVFWTEYVLRHAGAHHLRPASAQLSWYQLCLLDVLAVVLLSVSAAVATLYFIVRRILNTFSRKVEEKSDPEEKKKN